MATIAEPGVSGDDLSTARAWPSEGLTRVPYWVFEAPDVFAAEQSRLFEGPVWSYLCLEADIAAAGDFRTTFAGRMPVIVVRDRDGNVNAFENRCAHRGALIALDDRGNAKSFSCVYHAWSYDLKGNLKGVAFKNGVRGEGGMPASFCMEDHGPRKLRVETVAGLVFGTLSEAAPPLRAYLGDEIVARIERVFRGRTPVVLGRFTQSLPNNWKLYVENVKDSYHASILHTFFTTFELNRLSMRGGIIIDESGGHHVSFSAIDRGASNDAEYKAEKLRSEKESYRLADPTLLEGFDEFPDGVTLQILSVFPGFVLQQIQNAIAVRQVLPRGIERTDLHWTYLGFAEDTPEQRLIRAKQSNLVGPAGYVSMEDGCVGGFVQRGIASADGECAVLEMGGSSVSSQESRTTEASVRGFWKAYRAVMGL
ncbi:MAG TPA: aromatic ring-hydroxylating dioxygenase subunit alpha [Candidatus Elarobacter sp.]|nr:aromatic ring-hydroxylating dioxygenase subunit alpha [Candidatus Elarobacter sp.]